MKALVINCTLKPSPEPSNTHALAQVVGDELQSKGVEVEYLRAVDLTLLPGVKTDQGSGDEWPGVHEKLLQAAILVIASPTWVGRPSSVAQRVIERMNAMIGETGSQDRPVAFGRVAGSLPPVPSPGPGRSGEPRWSREYPGPGPRAGWPRSPG